MIPSSTFSEKKCRAKVVAEEASSRINREGSAAEFTRMRSDYEQHTILDRDVFSQEQVGDRWAVCVSTARRWRKVQYERGMTERI